MNLLHPSSTRSFLFRTAAKFIIVGLIVSAVPTSFPGNAEATTATTTQTTAGSYNFTVPAGVTKLRVNLWGGGGAGGGVSATTGGGGGGAGGQFATKLVTVTPGSSIPYVVAATKSGTSGSNGSAGNDSTFNSTTVVAKGGAGGLSKNNGGTGGVGATTNGVGDTVYAGGSGGASSGTSYSGAGGGGAGTTGAGGAASGSTAGSGKTLSGGSGAAGKTSTSAGGTGTQAGGGGGGSLEISSASNAGGTGAAGRAEIAYTIPTASTTAPNSGATVSGSVVTISATSSSEDGVAKVSFYIDNVFVASSTTGSPYQMTWNTTTYTTGSHTIFAVSQNNTGNYATSSTITVTVNNLAITGYTNTTESGLNYAASCTGCGARIGPAASGQAQNITLTGTGFNSATGTITIGTHVIPTANINVWTPTSISFDTDTATDPDSNWGTEYGGTSHLTVTAGGVTSAALNFYIFPQVTSVTQPAGLAADTAREYSVADSDGIITVNGTRFGSGQGLGSVAILGIGGTINSWTNTAIQTQVSSLISDSLYTGSIVVTQGTGSNNKTATYGNTFRILPRITGFTPSTLTNGTAVTFNGNHLCENGATCPTVFGSNDKVTFTSAVAATVFTSWTNTAMVTQVPPTAQSGAVTLTSNGYASNAITVTLSSPAPNAPSNAQQYYDNGLTQTIATGGAASTTPIYISMTMDPGASGGTLYPEVEYEPVGTAFVCSSATSCASAYEGTGVASSTPVDCSKTANNCAIAISPAENTYHWQVRVRKNISGTDYYGPWVSYPSGTGSTQTVYLTTTGSGTWTVPSDWNSASNTIEVIGGGGGGGGGSSSNEGGGGGGGGGYSKKSNITLSAGGSITYSIGTGGTGGTPGAAGSAGGDTYFCNSTSNCAGIGGTSVVVGAHGGSGDGNTTCASSPGAGATTTGAVGDVKYAGGSGGLNSIMACTNPGYSAGGGGGAAGPLGVGASGGKGSTGNYGGAGGGGADNGVTGGNAIGAGGNSGTGGAGGTYSPNTSTPGRPGTNGGGGGGGGTASAPGSSIANSTGGAGGSGAEWGSYGAGGGGGGGSGNNGSATNVGAGGSGGLYGGGGGGGQDVAGANGGSGAQGIIVITYVSAVGNAESATDFAIDKTPPVISSVSSGSPGTNSATITWNTGQSATSQVQFSTTGTFVSNCATNNDCTTLDPTLVTSHSVFLQNLNSGTTYYFRVRSMDAAGNEASSTRYTFTTSSAIQPAKTTRYHINGLSGQILGGATSTSVFSVPIPESAYSIINAFIEIRAIYNTTGSTPNGILVQVGNETAHTHVLPTGSASIGNISFYHPVISVPVGPATTTLAITPQANTSIYILSSDIIVTYGYTP